MKPAASATFCLTIQYDGSRYHGWQRQGPKQGAAGTKTVAGAIDRALHLAGIKILNLTGAGRTDSGVHALGQVASLHLARPIKASELHMILEQGLPYDIAATRIEPCLQDFDARRDALSRTYLYQVALQKCAFTKNFAWWPKRPLDLALLEEAWALFEGNHSMAAFADLEESEDPRCQIHKCQSRLHGSVFLLRVTARFFHRKQVRRMVGAAIRCSLDAIGKSKIGQIRKDLRAPSPQSKAFWAEATAPSAGLFLEYVSYPGHKEDQGILPALFPPI